MVSLAFIISFVVSAVAMLIGIVIFAEIEDGMAQTFGVPILIQNGTAGGTTTDSPMYVCDADAFSNQIREMDKTTGARLTSVSVPTSTQGCGGLSQDPTTGIWYMLGSIGGTNSNLITVDPTTGVGTILGQTGFKHNSMTFDGSGNLWSARAGAGNQDGNLYSLDKTTGARTLECVFPTLSKLNPMAFNYDNNKMYRIADATNLHVVDLTTCAESESVTITGASSEAFSFAYNTEDNQFYLNGRTPTALYTLQTDGTASLVATYTGEFFRGTGFTTATGVASPPIFEGGVPDEFAQSSNIALTVLGVLPIALFFGLFSILSGRGAE